jgi:hypothetical protein
MTDSSTDPALEADTELTPGDDAAPPTAPDGEKDETLVERVTANLAEANAEDSPPSEVQDEDSVTSDQEPEEQTAETEGEPTGDPDESELKRYSENAQNRIRQVIGQRNEAREQLETLQPKAEKFDQMTQYLASNNIETDELNNAVEVIRLVKSGDYQKAFDALAPTIQSLQQVLGKQLAPDLQQEVQAGYLDQERAAELQRLRMQQQMDAQRSQQEQQLAQQRQQEAYERTIQTAQAAADGWAKEKAASDPDWTMKSDMVAAEISLQVQRLGREGYPQTEQAVRELADQALATVESRLKKFAPKPAPVQRTPAPTTSSQKLAEPNSLLDAVKNGLASM